MTRDEAVEKVEKALANAPQFVGDGTLRAEYRNAAAWMVAALEAFGLIKIQEPPPEKTPVSVFATALNMMRYSPHSYTDEQAAKILNDALDAQGFSVVRVPQ